MLMLFEGHATLGVHNFFSFAQDRHGTRSKGLKLQLEDCRVHRRNYFFSVSVAKIWNAPPHEVVTSFSMADFKKQLDSADVMEIWSTFAVRC